MAGQEDLRNYYTAYDAREKLPELARWMSDEVLKQIPIGKGARFERGQLYVDLDNPRGGPLVADGDEAPIVDHTYACRNEMSERAWAELITWAQPVSREQAEAIANNERALGIGEEISAAGDARTRPPAGPGGRRAGHPARSGNGPDAAGHGNARTDAPLMSFRRGAVGPAPGRVATRGPRYP